MSTRRFCDVCGDEIKTDETTAEFDLTTRKPGGGRVRVQVKVTRAVDGVWNGGDCCVPCIRRAVAEGESTPASQIVGVAKQADGDG